MYTFAEPEVDRFIESRYPADAIQICGYHEAMEVFKSSDFAREEQTGLPFFVGTVDKINAQPHLQRRRALSPAFRRDQLDAYHERILTPTVDRALAEVAHAAASGQPPATDLVPFARQIFTQFAAALIGLRDVDTRARTDELLGLYMAFGAAETFRHSHEQADDVLARANEAKDRFVERFLDPSLAALPPQSDDSELGPEDHTIIGLLAAGVDPAWLDRDALVKEAALFLVASIDTSTNLLVNIMRELWRWFDAHPEDAPLRLDPGFMGRAVAEVARLHPNLPESARVAERDTELPDSTPVRAGQYVVIRKSQANHDQSVFGADAGEFNPRREIPAGVPAYGVSFGQGAHKCIGLPVVINPNGGGSHLYIATKLFAAGARPDPTRAEVRGASFIETYDSVPIVFDDEALTQTLR